MLCPPEGYGEAVVELLVTRRPGAAFKSYHSGEEHLTVDGAVRGAPALIGKAPDLVVIGLGATDMIQGADPEVVLEKLGSLIQLLLLKTQARVAVATVCTAFLQADARPAAADLNAGVRALPASFAAAFPVPEGRVRVLDLDAAVDAFLEAHRRGGGEKRSLHLQAARPTSTGRVFLSNTAYSLLDLDAFFTA